MMNPDLPDEILLEIFSRVPAKSVGKFRCLSKLWRTKLSTSDFIKDHLRHTEHQKDTMLLLSGGFIHTVTIPTANEDDPLVPMKLESPHLQVDVFLGSCDGLVLLLNEQSDDIFVVNPLTRQHLIVKNTLLSADEPLAYVDYGFGYDGCSEEYKIVKLSHYKNGQTSVKVYSLKNRVWKRLNNSSYLHSRDDLTGKYGINLNGAIHWLARTSRDGEYVIAAFDLATESFREIPAPTDEWMYEDYTLYGVIDIGGRLGVINVGDGYDDVLIMEEYGSGHSWTRLPMNIESGEDFCPKPFYLIGGEEIEAVLSTDGSSWIVWSLAKGTTKDIILDGEDLNDTRIRDAGTFMGSLVSPIRYVVAG